MATDFVSGSMVLAAPVELVFEYVSDYDHIPEWVAGISACRREPGAPQDFTVDISVGAVTHSVSFTTATSIPNRSIVLTALGRYEASVDIAFESAGPRGCNVTTEVRYPVEEGLFYRPVNKMGKLIATKLLERTGRNLAERIIGSSG
ncbi:SRPBCC family protein [Nocardia bhagyanarayanae]|uniref:Ribosome-associated toxin RatA of RatAB toxin-antitoxin module n=1 Tax=Nocardia bhagyanarayanae TaxID=1215925 RepID=A0A543FBB2_9NOCA|nr:SRPBCC family protein [Nocardia bhagyanarayanae]TQM31118.1 ribosome-associated toxin RatA of RatAB toxin-antitoxin module [Nocardia bhagyanarayanae]